MFDPSHPRLLNYRPRFHPQQGFQRRGGPEARAFYGQNNVFRYRPPHILENRNLEHWCETCDRGFLTSKHLEEHKLQHQKCNIDGCQFVAHPKVITKHIQMQHSSGLYKKISNLNNPEEIKKWREERKKNFPTRSNIEKRAAELKEKMDRGEKMGLKQGQRFRNSKPDNKRKLELGKKRHSDKNFKKKKISNDDNNAEIKHKPIQLKSTVKFLPPAENKIGILPFSGIQELVSSAQVGNDVEESYSNLLIEDDEHEITSNTSQNTQTSTESKPVLCGALVALMCQYGSSDEECTASNSSRARTNLENVNKSKELNCNIENIDKDNIVSKPNPNCDVNNTIYDIEDNDSGPEEAKIIKNIEEKDSENTQKETVKSANKQVNKSRNENKNNYHRKQKSKVPSTLLQKLLSKEMQQERNMVLQCVRYILRNNYFEK